MKGFETGFVRFVKFAIRKTRRQENGIANRANHANREESWKMKFKGSSPSFIILPDALLPRYLGRGAMGILVVANLCGCAATGRPVAASPSAPVVVEVPHAAEFPPAGAMQDAGVPLVIPSDRATADDRAPVEAGSVRFFWNRRGLMVEANFQDSDILAKGDADQLQHNELGDLLEIFLQPPGKPYYWELFVTPRGYQSSIFWNRTVSGKGDKGSWRRIHLETKVCSIRTKGFRGWQASVLVPFADLMRLGDASPRDGGWRVLVARQDYTGVVQIDHRELSSFPPLEKTDFHATEHFAELRLTGNTTP